MAKHWGYIHKKPNFIVFSKEFKQQIHTLSETQSKKTLTSSAVINVLHRSVSPLVFNIKNVLLFLYVLCIIFLFNFFCTFYVLIDAFSEKQKASLEVNGIHFWKYKIILHFLTLSAFSYARMKRTRSSPPMPGCRWWVQWNSMNNVILLFLGKSFVCPFITCRINDGTFEDAGWVFMA